MIIFLDFDGVLHPEIDEPYEFFCKLPLFWELLRKLPNAQAVFSTSWRVNYSFDDLVIKVTANGGEDLASRFIGSTPVHDGDANREDECLEWLSENNLSEAQWIALDDVAEWFPNTQQNHYLVSSQTGLTEEDIAKLSAW